MGRTLPDPTADQDFREQENFRFGVVLSHYEDNASCGFFQKKFVVKSRFSTDIYQAFGCAFL